MDRLQRAAIIIRLVQELRVKGDWCGETHLQKTIYFLQNICQVPLGFNYILYKHGPFSFDLSDEIGAMRADHLLEIQPQPFPYGPSFVPGSGSKSLAERFSKIVALYEKQITFVANKLGCNKVAELERLATALFVSLEPQADTSVGARSKRINELKPHISLEEARAAVKTTDIIVGEANGLMM